MTDEDSPLNDKELLSADLVVVDEFSMVDMRLAYILLDRIKSGAQRLLSVMLTSSHLLARVMCCER